MAWVKLIDSVMTITVAQFLSLGEFVGSILLVWYLRQGRRSWGFKRFLFRASDLMSGE